MSAVRRAGLNFFLWSSARPCRLGRPVGLGRQREHGHAMGKRAGHGLPGPPGLGTLSMGEHGREHGRGARRGGASPPPRSGSNPHAHARTSMSRTPPRAAPHGARCPVAPALPSPPPPRCPRSRVACWWNAPDARAERPMHAHMAPPAKSKPQCPARSLRKIYPHSPHPISTCGNLAWYGTCTRRSVSSS